MKNLILLLGFTLISACSTHYTSNAEHEYLTSRQGPVVQVPAPLTKQDFSQYYVLPTPKGDPNVSIVPPIDKRQDDHASPSEPHSH